MVEERVAALERVLEQADVPGPRTDEGWCMISLRTWVSETMMQVDHSVICLGR